MVFRVQNSLSQGKLILAFAKTGKSFQKLGIFSAAWTALYSMPSASEDFFDKSSSSASSPGCWDISEILCFQWFHIYPTAIIIFFKYLNNKDCVVPDLLCSLKPLDEKFYIPDIDSFYFMWLVRKPHWHLFSFTAHKDSEIELLH